MALPTPVAAFVRPGPRCDKTTEVCFLARAYPSAAWAAICSWRVFAARIPI